VVLDLSAEPAIRQMLFEDKASLDRNLIKSRMKALVRMLKVNTTIHTIHIDSASHSEHRAYRKSAIP
jgi:hypothetical protein